MKPSFLVEGGEEIFEIKTVPENLPRFCKACGTVGHAPEDCIWLTKSTVNKEKGKGVMMMEKEKRRVNEALRTSNDEGGMGLGGAAGAADKGDEGLVDNAGKVIPVREQTVGSVQVMERGTSSAGTGGLRQDSPAKQIGHVVGVEHMEQRGTDVRAAQSVVEESTGIGSGTVKEILRTFQEGGQSLGVALSLLNAEIARHSVLETPKRSMQDSKHRWGDRVENEDGSWTKVYSRKKRKDIVASSTQDRSRPRSGSQSPPKIVK